jgi:hypothetical protein
MFAWYPAYVLWMLPLIVAAMVGGILARRRVTIELAALTAVMELAFRFWEGVTDLFHSTRSGTCGSCRSGTSGSYCSQCSAPPSSSGARARCWGGCPIP